MLRIDAPERLVCARCEGGGCEGCGNSGALRARTERREIVITLAAGPVAAARVRLEDPFGPASPVRQLWVDLVPARADEDELPAALRFTPGERREPTLSASASRRAASARPLVWAALVVLGIVALLWASARGR